MEETIQWECFEAIDIVKVTYNCVFIVYINSRESYH